MNRQTEIYNAIASLYNGQVTVAPLSRGEDIKLDLPSPPTNITNVIKNRPKLLGRVLTYEFKGGTDRLGRRVNFVPAPYDLAEIGRASDVEPYISQSIRKHREQILKEGFTIQGTDKNMVNYIKRRLFEMTYATGISTNEWLRSFTTNLVTYHNSYLIFRRDQARSRGKNIRFNGKDLEPIAGIFIPDPTTMKVSVDKYGTPKRWKQELESGLMEQKDPRSFDVSDVLVCTMDKKSGYSYGTPYILPVLDDVRALRRLEELSMIIASKEAFPLYHYKVGTEENPAMAYEGGGDEVQEVSAQVTSMPLQGSVVTSERHEIKLISREGAALDLVPFLEYFEKRVMGGLRLSPLDLGRGNAANKGTAQNINRALQDAAKDYQRVISDCITYFLFTPLLLEGGFDVTHENLVSMEFNTIDKEEQRAHENHGSQLCLNSQITCTEFRREYLGKDPIPQDEMNDTTRQRDAEVEKELARVAAAARPASSTTATNKKTVSNKTRPANQNGRVTKSRITANDTFRLVDNLLFDLKSDLLNIKNTEKGNIQQEIQKIFQDFVTESIASTRPHIYKALYDGLDIAEQEFGLIQPSSDLPQYKMGQRCIDRFFNNFIVKSYWKVVNPYKDSLYRYFSTDTENNREPFRAIGAIEAFRKSIKRLLFDQLETARTFAFAKFAKQAGYNVIGVQTNGSEGRKEIDIADIRYTELIPELGDRDRNLSFIDNSRSQELDHEPKNNQRL